MQNPVLWAFLLRERISELERISDLWREDALSTPRKQLRHAGNAPGVIHEDVIRWLRERTDGQTDWAVECREEANNDL
jgi:hypothetical protein